MADTVYSKAQIDAIMAVIGQRITAQTDIPTLQGAIEALADVNFMTDAEKAKLTGIEGSKFLGTFTSVGAIPTVGAVAGSYADVDAGAASDVVRYVWDVNDAQFVQMGSAPALTAAQVKTLYESNGDTNVFTDAEKSKLGQLTIAANTTDAIAAMDANIS